MNAPDLELITELLDRDIELGEVLCFRLGGFLNSTGILRKFGIKQRS